NWGGKRNWKLPNINELQTLLKSEDKSLASEYLGPSYNESFWSSTTAYLYSMDYAYTVDLHSKEISFESKSYSDYVLCVMGKKENDTEKCTSDSGCPENERCINGFCYTSDVFVSKWNTGSPGTSNDNQIKLPLVENGTYDFTVFWGDGTNDKITKWNDPALTHTYQEAGLYTVGIKDKIIGWQFCSYDSINGKCLPSDSQKIEEIIQWGGLSFGDTEYQFGEAAFLNITAEDAPDLSKTKSLRGTFAGCGSLAGYGFDDGPFNKWGVSKITDMKGMFFGAFLFNEDISSWDVSNVTDMSYMFSNASSFNKEISGWDISNVINMSYMFSYASSFNNNISEWDVSDVTDMSYMFSHASKFNQNISEWNVSAVLNMKGMFVYASEFDQDISNWNISNVTNMSGMFSYSSFNQDISNWDVSKIKNMSYMFAGTTFNQDISEWNVSNVTAMSGMFSEATSFDQDLSKWDISNIGDMRLMFNGVTLSTANYDAILNGWSELVLQNDVDFNGGNSK
ncbi:MAG TPA: BspA family leucine-rich repeat surface protein, partial [bacterium]|nr:BspA family leucine-rich repeat surface protein [bacterium]